MFVDEDLSSIPKGPYRCPSCGRDSMAVSSQSLDGVTSDGDLTRAYFRCGCGCGFSEERELTLSSMDAVTALAVAVLRGEAGQPL